MVEQTITRGFARDSVRDLFELQPTVAGTLARIEELRK
jgi:hypothetical protein